MDFQLNYIILQHGKSIKIYSLFSIVLNGVWKIPTRN